jgi:hypothetical protein
MDLAGRFVHFWLSPSGRAALNEVVPGGADFETYVVAEDGLGVWVQLSDPEHLLLLKWEYFASASFEYLPEPLPAKPPAGFRGPD